MASELDDLERDLLQAADTWFDQNLHLKLQRLIAIAREGQKQQHSWGPGFQQAIDSLKADPDAHIAGLSDF